MKTLIASAILALMPVASFAQSSSWVLSEVTNTNKEPVGYIYHTYARGTSTLHSSKNVVVSGLRFVCSVKGRHEQHIAVFWNGVLMSNTQQNIEISVDKNVPLKTTWVREGTLIHSPVVDNANLINALKRGRVVRFNWEGVDYSKQVVAFDLKDFNLAEFNKSCKTSL